MLGSCYSLYRCKMLPSLPTGEKWGTVTDHTFLKSFESSLNWKPHFNLTHTAAFFLFFLIQNKRERSRRYCNKFYTHVSHLGFPCNWNTWSCQRWIFFSLNLWISEPEAALYLTTTSKSFLLFKKISRPYKTHTIIHKTTLPLLVATNNQPPRWH